jgi:hypothetical protein
MLTHFCHKGFGDNIYEFPFVVEMAKLYSEVRIMTPFPQLYWNHPEFKFMRPESKFKLQRKCIESFSGWVEEPTDSVRTTFFISGSKNQDLPILERMFFDSGVTEVKLSIDVHPDWKTTSDNICIVKPPTQRPEWLCPARNPKWEYFIKAVKMIKDKGYNIYLVGDTTEGEWFDDFFPAGLITHYGIGMDIFKLIGLVESASLCLCSPSFLLPLCLMLKTKCICIYGGYEHPRMHTTPGMNHIKQIHPEPFCECNDPRHACNKTIADFDREMEEAINA